MTDERLHRNQYVMDRLIQEQVALKTREQAVFARMADIRRREGEHRRHLDGQGRVLADPVTQDQHVDTGRPTDCDCDRPMAFWTAVGWMMLIGLLLFAVAACLVGHAGAG